MTDTTDTPAALAEEAVADVDGLTGRPRDIARDALARLLGSLDDSYCLLRAGQGDRLRADQVETVLQGGSLYDDEVFDEWVAESQWAEAHEQARSLAEELNDEERVLLLEHGLLSVVVEEILERNTSDLVGELLRQTPAVLVCCDLDHPVEPGTDTMEEDDLSDKVSVIAVAAGIDRDANAAALRELVMGAGNGGRLSVLAHVDPGDLADNAGGEVRRVTFRDPTLLILDQLHDGSGHEVRVSGDVVAVVPLLPSPYRSGPATSVGGSARS